MNQAVDLGTYLAIVNPLYAFPRWSMRNEKGANLKDAAVVCAHAVVPHPRGQKSMPTLRFERWNRRHV